MLKKALSLSLAVLALAPAAALAQSAGDDQYADPLAGQDNQAQRQTPSTPSTPSSNSGTGTSPGSTGSTGSGSSNPGDAQASASSPTQARSADTARAGTGDSASTLPRTGSDLPVLLSALGWVLLLTGIVARRTALDATAASWRRTQR